MNKSLGDYDTNSGDRSVGDMPTMQSGIREIRIGMRIGPDNRYLIKDVLGKGGMGEVYLALDEISKTEVAIKLVPREVSTSEDEMEQVRKNFALVRNLHHPNIAAVTALERLPSGEYILVMEAVPGRRTLQKERLSRESERLPVADAITICKQIAEALDYAHKQRVIHRDVKPSNVLLSPDGNVKLSDFGLAAQIMSSMNRVSLLPTRTSGTRPYMAPEQWEGRVQDVQTDQWALAVLFYELVAGRLPFPADDLGVLERQILEKPPEKPEALTGNQWTSLRRALSKEKEQRFPSCSSFLQAIQEDRRHALPSTERRRGPTLAAAILVLAAVIGYGAFRHFNRDKPPASVAPAAPAGVDRANVSPSGDITAHPLGDDRLLQQRAEARVGLQDTEVGGQPRGDGAGEPSFTFVDTANGTPGPAAIKPLVPGRAESLDLGAGISLDLVWVPATTDPSWLSVSGGQDYFVMGSTDDASLVWNQNRGAHRVRITRGFWLGKYEVSNAEYRRFLAESGYQGTSDGNDRYLNHITGQWGRWASPSEDYPVVAVSWFNATAFCDWLTDSLSNALPKNYVVRLPTEAEWEFACNAGHQGDAGAKPEQVGWCNDKEGGWRTHPVGKKPPNSWGLYDMYGNVWEWVHDWYEPHDKLLAIDPAGPATGRVHVIKGGSINSSAVASSARYFGGRDQTDCTELWHDTGFRVAVGNRISSAAGRHTQPHHKPDYSLRIGGVMGGGQTGLRGSVVLNGEAVGVGETRDGVTVVSVDGPAGTVVLRSASGTKTYRVGDALE